MHFYNVKATHYLYYFLLKYHLNWALCLYLEIHIVTKMSINTSKERNRKMKKLICMLLFFTLVLSLAGCKGTDTASSGTTGTEQVETTSESVKGTEVIVFTDEALENIVRKQLGKTAGDITVAEAEAVTELDLQLPGNDWSIPRISDLSDLKYFPNLTSLNLSWAMNKQGGVDLTPLSILTKLENLALACTMVKDIQPLSSLKNMKDLQLWGIRDIMDISPLANMTVLESLWITDNLISDLSPLSEMSKLNTLIIEDNIISDVTPLAALSGLKCLRIAGNPVKDYKPLSSIYTGLEEKDFELLDRSVPITFSDPVLEEKVRESMGVPEGDITPEMAEAVTELNLGNEWQEEIPEEVKINDIRSLRYFPNVFKLELYFNNISENVSYLTVLNAMPGLKFLDLNANKLNSYFELAVCKNLEFLNISGNQGGDLSPLMEMTNLGALYISYSPNIHNIEPLANLSNLNTLYMEDVRIDSYWPLKNLIKLRTLYICQADNYEPDLSDITDIYPNLTDKNFVID